MSRISAPTLTSYTLPRKRAGLRELLHQAVCLRGTKAHGRLDLDHVGMGPVGREQHAPAHHGLPDPVRRRGRVAPLGAAVDDLDADHEARAAHIAQQRVLLRAYSSIAAMLVMYQPRV